MIGVVPDLGRQVEGYREARLTLLEQVAVSGVGFLGVAETRVLAHRPEAAAIHRGLDASGVRELAGKAELREIVPAVHVLGCVEGIDQLAVGGIERIVALGGLLDAAGVGAIEPF